MVADRDFIVLTDQPIDAARVNAHVRQGCAPACGGICVFEGVTRGETSVKHGALCHLEYEAYADMAMSQMQRLAEQARAQWPIGALAMVHRTGVVPVGETSVMIAVASGHRDTAFTACRWLIDELKRDVPIWKREVWANGARSWSKPQRRDLTDQSAAVADAD